MPYTNSMDENLTPMQARIRAVKAQRAAEIGQTAAREPSPAAPPDTPPENLAQWNAWMLAQGAQHSEHVEPVWRDPVKQARRKTCMVLVAGLLLLGGVAALLFHLLRPNPAVVKERARMAYLAAMEEAVRARLKDGNSARFRHVVVSEVPGRALAVCGEVNARNSFGAYTGFTRFIAAGNLVFLEMDVEGGDMSRAWDAACSNPVLAID